jgi:serine/threonine-protein kinase
VVARFSPPALAVESRDVPEPAHAQLAPGFEPLALVGTTLDGRYELTAHLATGGMGAVFRGRHVHLRKDFAVKVLRPDLSSSPDLVERFRREAEIASALEHENIVRVSDFGRSGEGYLFLVMELLTGESLFDRLRREGFLAPEDAVPVLWQVCAGLEAAHALGVVHRDLKPENVYLARTSSGREVAKILDFGIAKIAGPASFGSTQAGVVVGTPEYLAPEQALGGEVDGRADLYAVGLMAWRALAGRHPFKADEPRALLMMQATKPVPPLTEQRPDLGAYPALVAAVARACAKDVAERHQSAGALKDDLAAAMGPAFVLPPNATPSPALSLSPVSLPAASPLPVEERTRSITPPEAASSAIARALRRARLRLVLARAVSRARAAGTRAKDSVLAAARGAGPAARALLARARARPAVAAAIAAGVLALAAGGAAAVFHLERPVQDARAHLEAGRAREALAVLDQALARRPEDGELLVLRARVLRRIPGEEAAGLAAYAAAQSRAPLDRVALEEVATYLASERSLADRAGRVLVDSGAAAVPVLARAAQDGPPLQRLRAVSLARDLGAEEQLDRVAVYGGLLEAAECEVRRAAATRLGEIGDRAAIPALRRLAAAKVETKGLFGMSKQAPVCGAAEAARAAKRIEASVRAP